MIDIVFPNGNEHEYLEVAQQLGIKGLVFAYDKHEKIPREQLPSTRTALLVDEKHISAARNYADIVIVRSTGDDRPLLERGRPDILYGMETISKKDFIHHRASGLNHILAALATRNNITIGFTLQTLVEHNRGLTLGRMAQNIVLCRKAKTPTLIASFARTPYEMRSPRELAAVFNLCGFTPQEIQKSLNRAEEILHAKRTR